MDFGFKPDVVAEALLRSLGKRLFLRPLIALGITPNQVTGVSTFVCGGAVILLLADARYWSGIAAILALLIGTLFDCLDGELARATNTGSRLGEWFDNMCDYIGQCMILIGLCLGVLLHYPRPLPIAACVIAFASQAIMVRYTDMFGGLFGRREEFWTRCRAQRLTDVERIEAHIISADAPLMILFFSYRYPLVFCLLIGKPHWFLLYIGVVQLVRAIVLHNCLFDAWGKESGLATIVRSLVLEQGIGPWPKLPTAPLSERDVE